MAFVDPDGEFMTHYTDRFNNILMQTNDGSDDVVKVPDNWLSIFKAFAGLNSKWGDHSVFDSPGWNNHWKSVFGLSERQLSERELGALGGFNTQWSRNKAVAYILNPTVANASAMAWSEALSTWTNPELVAGGVGAGLLGVGSVRTVLGTVGKDLLKTGEITRIKNAATRIGKPIHLVGSRASGTAKASSDWDYVIEGLNRQNWNKIKNSLPGAKSIFDNTPRNIDLFRGPLDPIKTHITFYPRY